MAGFLQPDDGLTWTGGPDSVDPATLSDAEKIDLLEREVKRLAVIVRELQPLVAKVESMERKWTAKERDDRSASARFGRR